MAAPARATALAAAFGAGLAMLLLRFPLAQATRQPWSLVVALLALAVLALPLAVAEAALGRARRRNVVDAFGPGPWRLLGAGLAVGALMAAALVAVLAGWAARLWVDSFTGAGFGDPDRHLRLLQAGPDELLAAGIVLALAAVHAVGASPSGLRRHLVAASIVAALLLLGLDGWAHLRPGASDADLVDVRHRISLPVASAAAFAGLLPALLATGVTARLAARDPDARLPRRSGLLLAALAAALLAVVDAVATLSAAQRHPVGGSGLQAFTQLPGLFASMGHAEGGLAQGLFFGAVLLAAFVALLALLDVLSTWLVESFASWTPRRASLATGLAVYLAAFPLCFSAVAAARLDQALAWVVAPLAGLFLASHVGWARPDVLDGLRIGDAGRRLDRLLVPVLRFVLPPVFALMLAVGTLGLLRHVGLAHGSGGLWALAP